MSDTLIGYVRKSKAGKALNISLDKAALDAAETYDSGDGRVMIPVVLNLNKVQEIIAGDREVTSISQIISSTDN